MMYKEGFDIVASPGKADIVIFTGGGDINPELYGEKPISETHNNVPDRDVAEVKCYNGLSRDQIKIGICRGGQLLNVLNGGSMYQDVNNHNHGSHHQLLVRDFKEYVWVNSYHHQMMLPNFDANDLEIIGLSQQSTIRKTDKGIWTGKSSYEFDPDFEILWYEATNSFCYQPHPEWGGDHDHNQTRNTFFKCLANIGVIN